MGAKLWYRVKGMRTLNHTLGRLEQFGRNGQRLRGVLRRGGHVLMVAWGLASLGGFFQFMRYEREPGEQVRAPADWPGGELALDLDRPTLVLAVHPKCPCTRASLSELEQILTRVGDRVRAYVVFQHMDEVESDAIDASLWSDAQRIAGVQVIQDRANVALRFGALTSGQTYLYDENGKIVFQGGITAARGQVGDNAGKSAILAYLGSRSKNVEQTPTYGCALFATKAR